MNELTDPRIKKYLEVAAAMKEGQFSISLPKEGTDDVAQLGTALEELARSLEQRFEEIQTLTNITARLNSGILLEDVLNYVFETFRPMIPYERIGCALIEEKGKMVRAHWARSDAPEMGITKGYEAPLEGSSLQAIIANRQPRILNDLEEYLSEHPLSESTQRIVREGMRSSLSIDSYG
jgi:nitrate/nitrite-specific signal transduction histidine kinase